MTRSFTPPRERRGRDATSLWQGLVGIGLVAALAGLAAAAGWLLAVVVAWVY